MKDFRTLKVWEKSHALAIGIYACTRSFPQAEQYGLTSQMRRAAISIGANIAEGCGRLGDRELARFLGIALGSASELEYLVLLSKDLKLIGQDGCIELDQSINEVKRMLIGLIRTLKT